MSYDLFFTSPVISREQFSQYFSSRNHYTLIDDQAVYHNQTTGVHFLFALNDEQSADDDIIHAASFNMNYFRPHYFALEAEPEIHSFIQHFNFEIYDYQTGGMASGPYSREGFLAGWNYGNQLGYSSVINHQTLADQIKTRSGKLLEQEWHWNYQREKRQKEIGETVFIPAIMYGLFDSEIKSCCVWPDGIPSIIPDVDLVIVHRDILAPTRFFIKAKPDICVIEQPNYLKLIGEYKTHEFDLKSYKLDYDTTPCAIKKLVKRLKPFKNEIEYLPTYSVLNRELVTRAGYA